MDGFPLKLEVASKEDRLMQLVVDIAKPEETEELHQFLVNYFISSSPLDQLYQVNDPDADEEILKLRRERPWWYDDIKKDAANLCLTIRDESAGGSMVALVVNTIEEKIRNVKKPQAKSDRRVEYSKWFNALLKSLNEGVDLYSTYETNRILHIGNLSVHPAYTRLGLGKKLIQLSCQLAEAHGAGAIEVEALNQYTFQAAIACGFQTHATLDFPSFELDGVKLFENDPVFLSEHPKARLMARPISNKRLMNETGKGLEFPKTLKWFDGIALVITFARLEECDEVMSFLDENLFSKSPEVHLTGDDKPKPGSEEEKKEIDFYRNLVLEECLNPSYSLTVRNPDKNGEIVAVSLNRVHHEGVKRRDFPVEDDSLFKEMWSVLNEPADGLFSLYKTTKVFHWYMMAVSPPYQRRGIATQLAQLCIQLGVEAGAGAIKVEAASEYTSRLADKLGFDTLQSIDYATFQYKGTTPLAENRYLLSEHSTARFMARSLP